jgi:hypothetical protein
LRDSSEALGLAPDLLRKPKHFEAVRQDARDPVHPRRDVDRFQDFLFFVRRRVQVGRDHVRQHRGRLDDWIAASSSCGACGRSCSTSTACPFSRTKRASMSVEVGSGSGCGNPQDARDEKRPPGQKFDDLKPLRSLADQMMRAVRRRDVTGDVGDGPGTVQVDGQRIDGVGVALHHDADRPLIPNSLLSGHHGARTADRDRQHDARETAPCLEPAR